MAVSLPPPSFRLALAALWARGLLAWSALRRLNRTVLLLAALLAPLAGRAGIDGTGAAAFEH
ncbi:MAG: hypothetical protein ACXV8M_11435 [Candidatus Angelobacter sp.]